LETKLAKKEKHCSSVFIICKSHIINKEEIMKKIKAGSFNPLPMVPIVLVGTNVNGKPNYMAVGFVNGVNITPPTVCISLNKKHHTPKGIIENGTFSINIPSADYIVETDYCGLVSGKTNDKSNIFTTFYGELETAPMIEEFPITCECKYIDNKVEFAMDIAYFGEVRQVYINEDIVSVNKKVDIIKANPLMLGIDNLYRTTGEYAGQAYQVGWKYKPKERIQIPGVFSDTYQCRLIDKPAQPTLTIRYQEAAGNIQQIIGQALFAIARYAGELGVDPAGAPFVAYHGMNGYNMDVEIGFTFEQKIKGKDNIQTNEIPGGKYASCIHIGPYDQLGRARAALNQWMLKNGYNGTGVSYEFYLNNPQRIPPDKLETQIIFPLI
jgi:flavin reductase (DIM6/NTAB) family NADH-FMN oxidoreductase RutF/effector-binding domain-containing protein